MKEDIIAMAREALVVPFFLKETNDEAMIRLRDFADLVRADERKRIADIIRSDKYGIGNMYSQWTNDDVADDILEGRA
jgi:hypothetical protein